jgi:hypothetical protein
VFACEWQQRHVPGALDRPGNRPLLLGRHACLAARAYLASLGDERAQQIDVLVVKLGPFADLIGVVAPRTSAPWTASSASPASVGASLFGSVVVITLLTPPWAPLFLFFVVVNIVVK